jgi:hypothetical protein
VKVPEGLGILAIKGKREFTLEDLDNIDYDELSRIVDASRKLKELRTERPWVRDIIRVLWGFRSGTTVDRLTKELWSLRNPSGLPEPKAFKKTVQSALNHHTSQSKLFKGRTEDDLFFLTRRIPQWNLGRSPRQGRNLAAG